ncbi:MAG: Uma2 family endonuclease [Chloroflexota bacterium]
MADNAITTEGMTLDEFIRRFATEGPFEILEAETVELAPNVAIHLVTVRAVRRMLEAHASKHSGEVFDEGTFVLEDKSDWVKGSRMPDVMYFEQKKFDKYRTDNPDWIQKPLIITPDLVVEVVSPGDTVSHLERKVDLYLQDGVKLVWVVNPMRKTVHVYTIGSKTITLLNTDDTLTGGDVLADFSVPVKDIFDV